MAQPFPHRVLSAMYEYIIPARPKHQVDQQSVPRTHVQVQGLISELFESIVASFLEHETCGTQNHNQFHLRFYLGGEHFVRFRYSGNRYTRCKLLSLRRFDENHIGYHEQRDRQNLKIKYIILKSQIASQISGGYNLII